MPVVDSLLLVDIGDVDLEVELTGTGVPVVVIQTALAVDELRPLCVIVARRGSYQVVHVHRRGYAGSGPARSVGSIEADAADAAALIEAFDAGPAHVVGVSYSAAVALSLASRAPELVATLTVVEPPPSGTPGSVAFRAVNRRLSEAYETFGAPRALDEFMTMLTGQGWRQTAEREAPGSVELMDRDAPSFLGSDVPALLSWEFGADEASRIRCPVLCIGGAQSGLWFTEMRARLGRLIPQADEATVDGAGHLVASTHPAEVATLLLEHLRRPTRGG